MFIIYNIENYLREHEVSPSYQRKRIFEYIYNTQNHPTVNQIYEELVKEIPTLSKTTVYNTLNLFIDKKLVEIITIEGNEARYDLYNPDTHGHFKCEKCQKVYDINIDIDKVYIKDLDGHEITDQYFHFKGICKECKKDNS